MLREVAEIRDPVHGYINTTEVERAVIDTPVFQRLRRLRQLSGAHLTYPGAQHSRFEHSLGAMHLGALASEVLRSKMSLASDTIQEIRMAALLHDTGHGAFSHLMEEVMTEKRGITHEDMSRRIILETQVNDILERYGLSTQTLAEFALGVCEQRPQFMSDLVGGGLSVDIMDYLLRDSYFTGVEYGKVDAHRIINAFEVVDEKLALDQAALYAFEALMVSRYEMFRAVYFHRSVRAAELMLMRAISLADDELHLTDPSDLQEYLSNTDEVTLAKLIDVKPHGRKELAQARELAVNYKDRRLLKCVFERLLHRKDQFIERIFSQKSIRDSLASQIAVEAQVSAEHVYVDVPTTPSVPLTSARQILKSITLVSKTHEGSKYQTVEVESLPLVGSISGYFDILRVYTVPEHRVAVEKAVNRLFEREGYATRVSM